MTIAALAAVTFACIAVIVESEQVALRCVEYLHRQWCRNYELWVEAVCPNRRRMQAREYEGEGLVRVENLEETRRVEGGGSESVHQLQYADTHSTRIASDSSITYNKVVDTTNTTNTNNTNTNTVVMDISTSTIDNTTSTSTTTTTTTIDTTNTNTVVMDISTSTIDNNNSTTTTTSTIDNTTSTNTTTTTIDTANTTNTMEVDMEAIDSSLDMFFNSLL